MIKDIWSFQDMSKDDQQQKNRNWAFIVYADSAPADWVQQIRMLHLPFAISPYHEFDKDNDTIKKPHWHCIIRWDGPTTYKYANKVIQSITCGPIVKPVLSLRGAYRYFTHMDNPEKYQYDSRDIRTFNDFEVELSESETYLVKDAIENIILVNRITECAELNIILKYEFGPEYSRVYQTHCKYFNTFISSVRCNPAGTYKTWFKYISKAKFDMYAIDDNHQWSSSLPYFEDMFKDFDYKPAICFEDKGDLNECD